MIFDRWTRCRRNGWSWTCVIPLGGCLLAMGGCWRADPQSPRVVVYVALDREFSEPVLQAFQEQSGVEFAAKYDIEAYKTVQLANTIQAERARPRCDVFWNNEILHTLRLEQLGLLDVYHPQSTGDASVPCQSAAGTWYGMAGRARVLLVNRQLVSEESLPTSIEDLAAPQWRGKGGIARPLFGTTATHAAVLYAHWGEKRCQEFFRQLRENTELFAGNKQVAQAVARGQIAFGLTDTDDALIELQSGSPVRIVYPDQGPDQMGTLFVPNTIAMIKGAPHRDAACRLMEYLLSAATERQLAEGGSGQIPLRHRLELQLPVETPTTIKAMVADFPKAAKVWPQATAFLHELFDRADVGPTTN